MRRSERARAALLALALASPLAAAEIDVHGLGPLENRKAEHTLQVLLGEQRRAALDAGAIEDAALILFSGLSSDGYLEPTMTVVVLGADGTTTSHPLDPRLDHPLPRPLAARKVRFDLTPGRRFVLDAIEFTGLQAVSKREARNFFVGEAMLFNTTASRIYTPERLRRAMGNLEEDLRQKGHAEAAVTLADRQIDEATGKVQVRIAVQEGLPWEVVALRYEVAGEGPRVELEDNPVGRAWSTFWRQNTTNAIRRWYFRRGFPDVRIELVPEAAPPAGGRRAVTIVARIDPGPEVHLGQVRFEGNAHTREALLRRAVHLQPGDLLNPIRLDNAEARLTRLGVFTDVARRYEPPDGDTRDAIFSLTEGKRMEVNLLFGYGSYEQLRGGLELLNYNVLGRVHSNSLSLVQSMKSTQAEDLYTVPELFGSSVDGSIRLFGLRREELSFLRQEYGVSAFLLWPLERQTSLTTGYTLKSLGNTDNDLATSPTDDSRVETASVEIGWLRDRRDSPLHPRHGYRLFARLEEASKYLGGQVDYQRLLLEASWHTPWGPSRWVHLAGAYGLVTTFGSPDDTDLPVNVRFYPGGEDSIRGYQRGEAAPRADNGQFIGAKTVLQMNVELEQGLTSKFSALVFLDSVSAKARLADDLFEEPLFSVGLGLRYHTIIGPVRLEYGHNLTPRPLDPRGTLLFSVGYPF